MSEDWASLRIATDSAAAERGGLLDKPTSKTRTILVHVAVAVLALISSLALILSSVAVSRHSSSSSRANPSDIVELPEVSRFAFGSCSAYDIRPQPEWVQGIIKSQPDAWLWVGDMAYLDKSEVNCSDVPTSDECACDADYMRHPGACKTGDVDHARQRFMHQLQVPQYQQFLRYMCPGFQSTGRLVPPGSDPAVCSRPILGVWDDHDFGWNNGNSRLPQKHVFKQLFLDAIGEPPGSPRRSSLDGMQASYSMSGGKLQALLLDQRYFRDPLPCGIRRAWCEGQLAGNGSVSDAEDPQAYAWCCDYLEDDGRTGVGSCCSKDERMAAWCSKPGNANHMLWRIACDPTSQEFGSRNVMLTSDGEQLVENDESLYPGGPVHWRDLLQESPFCDLLGMRQHAWLQEQLASSSADLVLVGSGSVLAGSMGYVDPERGECSEDDWNCYRPAQVNLVHTLGNLTKGCVVVLTGDYHYGDIKIIQPKSNAAYGAMLQTDTLRKPVYQLMSSGLTNSTARPDSPCDGYHKDYVGLRPFGECSMVTKANFGMVQVDWKSRVAALQLRDSATGEVARDRDGVLQELRISLATCQPVKG